ncbi:GPN-loop GTPase 3 [Entamoeba marina]
MGKCAQIIMGPAGSGKSTYCRYMKQYLTDLHRRPFMVNLDPALDESYYDIDIDIRDLVTIEDVMENLDYGPNGALVYCMEYLLENLEWLSEELGDYDDDYLIIDCPGQIELYSHLPVMSQIVEFLKRENYMLCGVFLVDSQVLTDSSKYVSAVLCCLSVMSSLEIPHINVLSKMDLWSKNLQDTETLYEFLDNDPLFACGGLDEEIGDRFHKLNVALVDLIQSYSLVGFTPLNIKDEDTIDVLLQKVDTCLQYYDDVEPQEPKDMDEMENMD